MTLLLRACGVQDILLSAEGIPTGTDPNKPVSSLDSEDPHWAEPYIHTAMTLGIIRSQEYPDGFEPDAPITRMEICAMAVRALGLEDEASDTAAAELGFADSEDIPATYRGYVSKAVEWDVLRGYPDNTFQPGNYATRREAAVIIYRLLDLHYQSCRGTLAGSPVSTFRRLRLAGFETTSCKTPVTLVTLGIG